MLIVDHQSYLLSVSLYSHKILLLGAQFSLERHQLRSFVPLYSRVGLGTASLCLNHHLDCLLVRPLNILQFLPLQYLIFLELEHGLRCELVHIALRQSCSCQLREEELIGIKQPIIYEWSTYIAIILLFLANSLILSSFILLSTSFFSSSCCFCSYSRRSSSFLELFLPLMQLI